MCVDDELLSAYLDGELQEPWRTQVEQHLQYCKACASRFLQLKELQSFLVKDGVSPEEIARRQARVLSFFEKSRFTQTKRVSLFRKTIEVKLVPAILSSAAAFVVVFVGAFVVFGTNSSQNEPFLAPATNQLGGGSVRQVSEVRPAGLDAYSVDEIVSYLSEKGYDVNLTLKSVEPLR